MINMSATKIILIAAHAENQISKLAATIEEHCAHTAILATANNIEVGEELINTHNPHLVILELYGKENEGLNLLERFDPIPFQVIIVSNNAQFNEQVMKYHPAHYMLMPIPVLILKNAIAAVRKNKKDHNIGDRLDKIEKKLGRSKKLARIGFLNNGKTEYHSVKDIMYIQADDNYCRFILVDGSSKLVTHTMKYYADQLNKHFIKISRSNIVNKDFIKCIHQGTSMKIELLNGTMLEVSRDYKTDVKEEMERN